MSKLTRYFQKVFGSTAAADKIGIFGSLAAGNPQYATTPTQIQSLSNFLNGWSSAVIGNNSPCLEDMNALFNLVTYQLAYLFQQGVPEYDTSTTYYIGSVVSSAGNLYQSLIDTNLNQSLTDLTKWRCFGDPPGIIKSTVSYTIPTGYLLCDGSSKLIAEYPALSSALLDSGSGKYAFGSADGTHFNVPDLRGRFLRGTDDMGTGAASIDPDRTTRTALKTNGNTGNRIGSAQANATKPNGLGVTAVADHVHASRFDNGFMGWNNSKTPYVSSKLNFGLTGGVPAPIDDLTTPAGAHAHALTGDAETRPTNVNINYIIKT